MNNLAQIFISYRRDDTDAVAENIYHHLRIAFGENAIFKDNMRIGPGDQWDKVIQKHLASAKVVLVLIGRNWFCMDEEDCIRLENEEDWVRKEIVFSLQNDKTVIPILIDGKKCPTPKSLRNIPVLREQFPFQQGYEVDSRRLEESLHKLIYHDLAKKYKIALSQLSQQENLVVDVLADYPLPRRYRLPVASSPPYIGLRPFHFNEACLFFGRDNDILKLIKLLESEDHQNKIILYHGRSGVGKSSLLNAGLYLRLKAREWEVPPPRRRDKEFGLARALNTMMEGYSIGDNYDRLFVLDQVEEMFSVYFPQKIGQ